MTLPTETRKAIEEEIRLFGPDSTTPDYRTAWLRQCLEEISGLEAMLADSEHLRVNASKSLIGADEVVKRLEAKLKACVEALEKIVSRTEDMIPPFRAMGVDQMANIAKAALEQAR